MLLAFSLFSAFMSPPDDRWIAKDKGLHFICSFAIVGLSYHFYHCQLGRPEGESKVVAVSFTGLVGIGKEVYDSFIKKKGASWKDLVFDALGIGAGILFFTWEINKE
ncbi:hypothetical protein DRQ18_01310 [bacterium]|nr:MAG: hypothetical protein DRQ18_01310 [bacterium]